MILFYNPLFHIFEFYNMMGDTVVLSIHGTYYMPNQSHIHFDNHKYSPLFSN